MSDDPRKVYTMAELLGSTMSEDEGVYVPTEIHNMILQTLCDLHNAKTCFVILSNEVVTEAGNLQLYLTINGTSRSAIPTEVLEQAGLAARRAYNQALEDAYPHDKE
jgi:hypothetical protein